jgi:hypothetical protein
VRELCVCTKLLDIGRACYHFVCRERIWDVVIRGLGLILRGVGLDTQWTLTQGGPQEKLLHACAKSCARQSGVDKLAGAERWDSIYSSYLSRIEVFIGHC